MNKKLVSTVFTVLFATSLAVCQELLDPERYKAAELFVVKKGYDVQERLQEIKSIEGKEVTVYQVSGKNKIKLTYTGTAEMSNVPQFSDKQRAGLIVIRTKENGTMKAYFPLTNDNRYRIYLTEKMK